MKMLTFLTSIFLCASLFANTHIICKTPTAHKSFRIIGNNLVMQDMLNTESRIPSSSRSLEISATGNRIHQRFQHDGNTLVFHVENREKLSEVNDYLTVSNLEGHKITFPLTCQQ